MRQLSGKRSILLGLTMAMVLFALPGEIEAAPGKFVNIKLSVDSSPTGGVHYPPVSPAQLLAFARTIKTDILANIRESIPPQSKIPKFPLICKVRPPSPVKP